MAIKIPRQKCHMPLFSLLYASRSIISADEAEAAVEALVKVSQERNHALRVTGCLIFGGGRFAQVLEGDKVAVDELMHSISHDPRHTDVTVLKEVEVSARAFTGWDLGYAGPSLFIQRTIKMPVREALRGSERGISDLLSMMTAFRSEQISAGQSNR